VSTFYAVCAALGGLVLVLQVILSLIGVVDEGHGDASLEEGLDLLSVRSLSAGAAFLGLGGFFGLWLGLGPILSLPLALVTGAAALIGTAVVTRAILGLESDRSHLIEEAIGEVGTVYLSIPGAGAGEGEIGKVHVTIRERLLELGATTKGDAIPTGATVRIVDTVGDLLVVEPLSPLE
jgi:hypothetical protein